MILIPTRMGYGAMQLAGPHVFGPPKDHDGAIAVLREVVRLGIRLHSAICSDFLWAAYITNQLIKEALYPYPEQLRIVTKLVLRPETAQGNSGREPARTRRASGELLMITSQTSGSPTAPLMWSICGLAAWTRSTPGLEIAEPFRVLPAQMQKSGSD